MEKIRLCLFDPKHFLDLHMFRVTKIVSIYMWKSSKNYVFYDIFINTTKHLEMLFKAFPETQPNTSKYFSF